MGGWEEEDMVTSTKVVVLHHTPPCAVLHACIHTHTLRPTLEHCSKVKQKDTTWTGSEIRGCGKLWDEQRATLAETLKIKDADSLQQPSVCAGCHRSTLRAARGDASLKNSCYNHASGCVQALLVLNKRWQPIKILCRESLIVPYEWTSHHFYCVC